MIKFETISEEWLKSKQHLKKSTISTYRSTLNYRILSFFKNYAEITNKDVQSYILYMTHKRNLSKKTINDSLICLNDILKFGAKKGLCKEVVLNVEYPTILKTRFKRKQALNIKEVRKLRKHLVGNISFFYSEKYFLRKYNRSVIYLALLIVLDTGMRAGEVLGLEYQDVDFINKKIFINKTVSYIPDAESGKTSFYVRKPKTKASKRSITVSDEVLNFIKQRRSSLTNIHTEQPYGTFIFKAVRAEGTCHGTALKNNLIKILEKLKLPVISTHELRHSFASNCIASDIDVKTTSALLGHSSAKMTLAVYTHTSLEQKRKAMNKIGKIFS